MTNQTDAPLDVVVAHAHSGASSRSSESMSMDDHGVVTVTGHELLSAVAIPPTIGGSVSTIPQGGVLAMLPANPRLIDGSRIAGLMANYDQYTLRSVTFHYTQATNLTQSGQILLAFINDPNDKIFSETGFAALRDAYARNGSVLTSVRADAHCTIDHPLLKWYFTSSDGTINLELPGYIAVFNMLDFSNATASSIPLGTLSMSYEIALRSPAAPGNTPAQYMSSTASLALSGLQTTNQPIATTVGGTTLPATLTSPDVVYWGTVVSADDVATGNSTWRQWRSPVNSDITTVSPGNLLFWRVASGGGSTANVGFFPTFAAAADAIIGPGNFLAGDSYFATVNLSGALRGFKLWNVMGARVVDPA